MARFGFRFHPVYRVLGAPFGVTERTTQVEVAGGHLLIRFGPWTLRTPLANVAGWQRTGPFSVPKTAGPARLSIADRGVTFATNPDAGLCVCFVEPVPAIDPLGSIRHPGATVTVDRIDDLEKALADPDAAEAPDMPADEGTPVESPQSVLLRWARWPWGMGLATARHLRALGEVQRTFADARGEAPAPRSAVSGEGVQRAVDGVGALFERTYRVRIAGSPMSPEDLLASVSSNFNHAAPVGVADFAARPAGAGGGGVGTEYQIRMPGPWDGPVRVVEQTPLSVCLATLDGHMEAGQIEFLAARGTGGDGIGGDPVLVFEIRSLARSADRLFDALYDRFLIAREMQLHTWVHFCRRVVDLAGGRAVGKVEVTTIRHDA